jgi:uncharacterized protein (DUF433 family)
MSVIAAFSVDQVQRLTGLSQARILDWDRKGFFTPSYGYERRSSPYSRIYSFDDVVGLRTLSMLRSQVSMQHLRKAAEKLKQHSGKPWSELTFYVLNREVHFSKPGSEEVEGAVSGQRALPIRLVDVAADMRREAANHRRRDPSSVGNVESRRSVLGGAVCIAGTRVPVSTVQAYANAGYSPDEIRERFPTLELRDVETAISAESGLTHAA